MEVVSVEQLSGAELGSAVTIGAYDGVHIGHRHLLDLLRARADALGVPAVVVTFDRHPATVIRPESAPLLLTDNEQKLELLASCGVDLTVVVRFDAARASESAEDFVEEVLCGALGAKVIVVGRDFHFGRKRSGDVELLRRLGALEGFSVVGVALSATGHPTGEEDHAVLAEIVSSTRIRALLAAGDVAGAARLLGRAHEVRGEVVHGDGRGGSQLGMPTANVSVPSTIAVPALGIYAGWCRRADRTVHPAAISVGVRPTFAATGEPAPSALVEAHLIDFEGDLYGERIGVMFTERLRDERRFDRVQDLVDQMWADVRAARRALAAAKV
ncbi:MAG: bifunctional riboflavin kinase/FAD synthetase [Actinomycetota bacterium]|nr:bifunctional riboflavin kinase/FAD synthetase [Actinomycetota bacterium]